MSQIGYRRFMHVDSLTAEAEDANPAWRLQPVTSGSLRAGGGGIVTDPGEPARHQHHTGVTAT